MRDAKDTCERCPAWNKHIDQDGREILIPLRGPGGEPVTKDGVIQCERGGDGRFLMTGSCCLRAPKVFDNGITAYPSPKSNWFCHDPERYAMLDRMKQGLT